LRFPAPLDRYPDVYASERDAVPLTDNISTEDNMGNLQETEYNDVNFSRVEDLGQLWLWNLDDLAMDNNLSV
jgi:hypothetical protein